MKPAPLHLMMKIKQLGIILSGLSLCACAHTPSDNEIKSQCRLEMEAARTAVQLREQGKTKQAMLETLPPLHSDSTRLLRVMYQSINDTYDFPNLNENVYGAYRLVYCIRRARHKNLPNKLSEVSEKLMRCQNSFGKTINGDLISCIRGVFPDTPSASTKNPDAD